MTPGPGVLCGLDMRVHAGAEIFIVLRSVAGYIGACTAQTSGQTAAPTLLCNTKPRQDQLPAVAAATRAAFLSPDRQYGHVPMTVNVDDLGPLVIVEVEVSIAYRLNFLLTKLVRRTDTDT
ncbi:hypothetical protein E4U59_005083 [Claviceps monticola]|nr:hypothetical protein E4U59_005083 [Claviceps monticola]